MALEHLDLHAQRPKVDYGSSCDVVPGGGADVIWYH
jgi:hypothetical protein